MELLAIDFGVERFRKYTDEGEIVLDLDHKAFGDDMWKTPTSAPRWLQKMFMCLQRYDIDIQYKRVLEMYLVDTFSGPFTGDEEHLIRSDPGKQINKESSRL